MTSSIGCTPSSETRRVCDGLHKSFGLVNAVDPDTNEVLQTQLEPTTNSVLAQTFVAERRGKHDTEDAVVLIDGSHSLKDACRRHGLDCRYKEYGNRNSVKRVFREIEQRTTGFSNCFSNAEADTADEWLRSVAFAWNQRI